MSELFFEYPFPTSFVSLMCRFKMQDHTHGQKKRVQIKINNYIESSLIRHELGEKNCVEKDRVWDNTDLNIKKRVNKE